MTNADYAASTGPDTLDQRSRLLVKDLHSPSPAVYWVDLALTAGLGWTAFAVATIEPLFSVAMFSALVVSALALYRGLCFLHELSHLKQSALRGFEAVWNLLLGIPLLMPSFIYVGVHQNHHKTSTYGTAEDPEYLPFAGRKLMIVLFAAESLILPLLFAFRFLVLSPFGLVSAAFHRWLVAHASSLSMNVKYARPINEREEWRMKKLEIAVLACWAGLFTLFATHRLPWRALIVWFMATSLVSFINTLRTLGAHHYESDGAPRDRNAQWIDSIDTPGAWWTVFWAPVGLRYHALHHYFPGIPYHNLGKAYRRLVADAIGPQYEQVSSRSLMASLSRLYSGRTS